MRSVSARPASSESRAFVAQALRDLSPADAVLPRPVADIEPALLLELWPRTRHYGRDGLIRLLQPDPAGDWSSTAGRAGATFLALSATGFAELLDLTDDAGAIRGLLMLRRVFHAVGHEIERRLAARPVAAAFVRVRQDAPWALAELRRWLRPRPIDRELQEEALQRAAEALAQAWSAAPRPALHEAPLASPFRHLPAPAGWDAVADQLLSEEIGWILEDYLPALTGTLDRRTPRGRVGVVHNAERSARRATFAAKRGGPGVRWRCPNPDCQAEWPWSVPRCRTCQGERPDRVVPTALDAELDPTPRLQSFRSPDRPDAPDERDTVAVLLEQVRRRFPHQAHRALELYLTRPYNKTQAAEAAGVSPKTFARYLDRVKPMLQREDPRT